MTSLLYHNTLLIMRCPVHPLLLFTLLVPTMTLARTSYLHVAQPSGSIRSVSVDSLRAGVASDLHETSLSSLSSSVGQLAEISFDEHTQHALILRSRPSTLTYMPLCRRRYQGPHHTGPDPLVLRASTNFAIVSAQVRGSSADCAQCHAGPFALFDDRVYFILTGDFGLAPLTRSVAQLRVMQSCGDCPLDNSEGNSLKVFKTPFLFNCSRVVAEVLSEPMQRSVSVHLKAGRGLRVVKSEHGLQFFFQLFVSRRRWRQRARAELLLYRYRVRDT